MGMDMRIKCRAVSLTVGKIQRVLIDDLKLAVTVEFERVFFCYMDCPWMLIKLLWVTNVL